LLPNDEYSTVRVLHHPRRNAPDKKPSDGTQPLGPHHDQVGMLFGGHVPDLFRWLPKFTHRLSRKSRLDQLLHALFDYFLARPLRGRVLDPRYHMDHAHMNRHALALADGAI